VISCDNVVTVPKQLLDTKRIGRLGRQKRVELDGALRYALDIQY
jgi:hypothetical protein